MREMQTHHHLQVNYKRGIMNEWMRMELMKEVKNLFRKWKIKTDDDDEGKEE